MDVSIAVSLIRGQMGAVVERAVNGAVETVLAEMLRVVGVKFEELKAQVALMKRDVVALQREKALKEKENDSIRAKLRYTELKLKYYRQGVEEELQQRVSASTAVRVNQSSFSQGQPGGAGVSSAETSPSQGRDDAPIARGNLECTSPQKRPAIRVRDVQVSDPSDLLSVSTQAETLDTNTGLFLPVGKDMSLSKDEDREDDSDWSISVHPHPEGVDITALPVQTPTLELEQQTAASTLSPDGSIQADSSTLHFSIPQIKQEPLEQQEEEQVICIKEEPEEEQEVMASLLLDCHSNQSYLAESEPPMSVAEWSAIQANQRNRTQSFNSAGQSSYPIPQPAAPLPSVSALPSGMPPRQMVRPWNKDLLYEEYKVRRNELRRRSLNRRRELEKNLPQPLLADLVRERREKTRLRVARWRAKRKLQACLNQTQGGAAGLSQNSFPLSSQQQQQQLKTCVSPSSSLQRQNSVLPQSNSSLSNASAVTSITAPLPFINASSSSSVLLRGPNAATHINQHTVTSAVASSSSSSSSSYPQVSLSHHQSTSLMDSDILQ